MNSLQSSCRRRLSVGVALVAVVALGCSDAPTAPPLGTLRVSVETSGGDLDVDGYEFVVDSGVPRYVSTSNVGVQADGTQRVELAITGIGAGTHSVSLIEVADNCTVSETNPRSVTIAAGKTVPLGFAVVCAATGVAVTTHTTGSDVPFAFDLHVDQSTFAVSTNGNQIVSRLEPGPHMISLQISTGNCSVAGGVQTVTVPLRTITPVHFEVSCVPVVRLEKIAYVVDTTVGGKAERMIALVKPDGSGAAALGIGDSPSWSPDGTQLVLTEALCESYDAYYGNDCGGGLVVVDPEKGNRTPVSGASAAFGPAWSPTGDIAFTRCCTSADRNRIYLMRPDGSLSRQLTIPQAFGVSNPGWSPDGKRIAFVCSNGQTNDLCVIDTSGNGFARLTNGDPPFGEGRPAWRPDGTSIAFARYSPGSTRPAIVVLNLDGGTVTRVTEGSAPAWSPDGSRLVFGGVGISGLFTVNVDGSNLRHVTTGAHSAPAWRP